MSDVSKILKKHYFSLALLVIFMLLILRDSGVYPSIFADEYTYSMYSRLLPLSDSTLPNYLYLAIYRLTNVCGDNFLQCSKIFNAIFFVAAAPFIYGTAKRYCDDRVAAVIALLSVLGPINVYTALFMPEPLYFLSFWIFSWYVLGLSGSADRLRWFFAGAILGVVALVKPHALLFIPAILVYIGFAVRSDKPFDWVKACLCFLLSVIIVKLAGGYILAGRAGLTIMGQAYSAIASDADKAVSFSARLAHYKELLIYSARSMKGHVEVIAVIYAMPLAATAYGLCSAVRRKGMGESERLSLYTFLIIANLMCVTALFTASIFGRSPEELITRLHMRYYNFALPLLYIVAAVQLRENIVQNLKGRLYLVVPIVCVVAYALLTRLAPFTPSHVDGPEIRGITAVPHVFALACLLSIGAAIVWAVRPKLGAMAFLFVVVPIFATVSTAVVSKELRLRVKMDAYDRAGLFVRSYIPKDDREKILIVGDQPAALFRALFYVDEPKASLLKIASGAVYDTRDLPAGKEWLITVGSSPVVHSNDYQMKLEGFTLTRVVRDRTIEFHNSDWPGIVSHIEGLSTPEPWGTWSDEKRVVIVFSAPLPEHVGLGLVASAYGRNIGKRFVAKIGDRQAEFELTGMPEQREVQIDNPSRSNTITIEIPDPTAPSQVGASVDMRTLGIGLVEMQIR